MKPADLRELDDNALAEFIRTQRRELFGLRFSHATGELGDLARALTIAHQREVRVD
jgi:large subunit ribosomal protein L29